MKHPKVTPGAWHLDDCALWGGRHGLSLLATFSPDEYGGEATQADMKMAAAAPTMYVALNSVLCEVRSRGIKLTNEATIVAAMIHAGASE